MPESISLYVDNDKGGKGKDIKTKNDNIWNVMNDETLTLGT